VCGAGRRGAARRLACGLNWLRLPLSLSLSRSLSINLSHNPIADDPTVT
jgi:hypothetical protein